MWLHTQGIDLYAEVNPWGNLVFDFGGNKVLVLSGVTTTAGLADAIDII